jgi:hypothetical protein
MGGEAIVPILISLVVMASPWLILGTIAYVLVRRSPLWKALTERVRDGDQGERLAALEGEVMELRQALAEMQERQDFAERMLADPKK